MITHSKECAVRSEESAAQSREGLIHSRDRARLPRAACLPGPCECRQSLGRKPPVAPRRRACYHGNPCVSGQPKRWPPVPQVEPARDWRPVLPTVPMPCSRRQAVVPRAFQGGHVCRRANGIVEQCALLAKWAMRIGLITVQVARRRPTSAADYVVSILQLQACRW